MLNFEQVDVATANGETEAAFAEAKAQFGAVINLFKTIGHAPNVLNGILALNKEINSSTGLDSQLIEQVAMLTSALNKCDYCVNVHMQVGKGAGLSKEDLILAMSAKATDPKAQALLDFTNEVIRNRGLVGSSSLTSVAEAGFSEKDLLETIGIIGMYTTLQYIRHLTNPDQDFPIVTEFDAEKHGA